MAFTVRQADRNDGDIIRLMLTAEYAQAGYADQDIKALKNTPHHPDSMTEKILAAIDNSQLPTRCWLAIADRRAAGIITTKDISGGVYVDPEFRRQGIASALGTARDDFQRQSGASEAVAHIEADNEASLRAFEKLGYCFNEKSAGLVQKAREAGKPLSSLRDEETGRPALLVLVKPLLVHQR